MICEPEIHLRKPQTGETITYDRIELATMAYRKREEESQPNDFLRLFWVDFKSVRLILEGHLQWFRKVFNAQQGFI